MGIGPWYMDALQKQPHSQQMQEQELNAQSEQKQSAQSMKPPMSEPVMQSQHSEGNTATPIITNKPKWFWMDMDNFEWVAYRDEDQIHLNNAFDARRSRVDVVYGKYRVEFEKGNVAAGNQFQNDIKDPINHMVIRAEVNGGL